MALAGSLGGCQGDPAPAPAGGRATIEVIVGGKVAARVTPGHPCRATVAGVELIVGGPPLVSQQGEIRWTGETRENGTTFKRNDRPVARIHANQLFDAQGIPLVKVLDDGNIANGPGRIVRVAAATHDPVSRVTITSADRKSAEEVVVTNTEDVVLAGLLAAPEPDAEIRALAACHLLLTEKP